MRVYIIFIIIYNSRESFLIMKTRGLFIVFEGVNGSSKTSTINEIMKYSIKYGRVKVYKFPDRSGYMGDVIDDYLNKRLEITSTYDKLDIFSKNRLYYLEEMIELLNDGVTIICDRYVYSAIVYQFPINRYVNDLYIYHMASIIGYFDKFMIKPDLIFLLDADFLNKRSNTNELYHYNNERQIIVRNYFKRLLSMSDIEHYIITPIENNINGTACLIMNILDTRFSDLAQTPLDFFCEKN